MRDRIGRIDGAIARSHAPVALTVYRGMTAAALGDIEAGEVYADPAFLSTSLAESSAEIFKSGAMMTIRVPAGSAALYMDELAEGYGHEVEILLPRGSRLRIVRKERIDGVWHVEAELEP